MPYEESHSGQDNLRNVSQCSDMGVQGIKNDSKKGETIFLPKYHCIRHFDLSLMLSCKLHVIFISYKSTLFVHISPRDVLAKILVAVRARAKRDDTICSKNINFVPYHRDKARSRAYGLLPLWLLIVIMHQPTSRHCYEDNETCYPPPPSSSSAVKLFSATNSS